jgi:hypothetical protein
LATGPITNLIKNSINGTSKGNDYQKSLDRFSEEEPSLNFYTCALYAVQKERCRISQERVSCSLENDQTKLAEIINPIKEIIKMLPQKSLESPKLETQSNVFKEILQDTLDQKSRSSDVNSSNDNQNITANPYKEKFKVDQAELFYDLFFTKPDGESHPGKLDSHIDGLEKKFDNILKNKTDTMESQNQNEAVRDLKLKLTELKDASKKFKKDFNVNGKLLSSAAYANFENFTLKLNQFFKEFPENLNDVSELALLKTMFNIFNNEVETKQKLVLHEKVREMGNNISKLNDVLTSIFRNTTIHNDIVSQIEEYSRISLKTEVGLEQRLRFCLSGLQWRSHDEKKIKEAYTKACQFLNSCSGDKKIGLMDDFLTVTLPDLKDTDYESYQPICDTNMNSKYILDRALINFNKKSFCGKDINNNEAINVKK